MTLSPRSGHRATMPTTSPIMQILLTVTYGFPLFPTGAVSWIVGPTSIIHNSGMQPLFRTAPTPKTNSEPHLWSARGNLFLHKTVPDGGTGHQNMLFRQSLGIAYSTICYANLLISCRPNSKPALMRNTRYSILGARYSSHESRATKAGAGGVSRETLTKSRGTN